MIKCSFSIPSAEDRLSFEKVGLSPSLLAERVKITATDEDGNTADTFMKKEQFDKLGEDYIREHAELRYGNFQGWYVEVSEDDFYNDLQRNPKRVIRVVFDGLEEGTGREVYKGEENGRYYLREVLRLERFAKWYVCGTRRCADDGLPPRANLIFMCGNQSEKLVYHDWNGACAYKETFNKNFCPVFH